MILLLEVVVYLLSYLELSCVFVHIDDSSEISSECDLPLMHCSDQQNVSVTGQLTHVLGHW
jgi:hypothetical protein